MRLHAAWALAFAALLALAALAAPVRAQEASSLPPQLDARAHELYAALLCPQCRGQSIGESSAPVAVSMRQTVREMLVEGASDEEIIAFMVGAFGESVLASPPKRGVTLLIWVIPPIALALGALAVALALRSLRRTRPDPSAPVPTASNDAAAAYLSVVDAELGAQASPDAPPSPDGAHRR
jgi:cytochrome c-type biogenesis protein CcmH